MISFKPDISELSHQHYQLRWLSIIMRVVVILLGVLHGLAAIANQSMNADGISYLDIGDAYMRGDWETAISSVWSPMYSWILGLVMLITKPRMHWEFPFVQIVNFSIYLFAFGCFNFFWRQLTHYRQMYITGESGERWVTLPDWAWLSLGYILFVISSLQLIEIWAVTPDMLMAAFVYLAAGLVVRLRLGLTKWRTFILLGVVLGMSYLTKAVMFPLAFIFICISLFSTGNQCRVALKTSVTLLIFLLMSLPFITAIYIKKGKLTFGDAGNLTYARYINSVPYPHWQGHPPGNGRPLHPSRKILDSPPIYEFANPVGGTYPISYDPSYWYEGVTSRFDLKGQINYLLFSALFYSDLFLHQQAVFIAGILLLYMMRRKERIGILNIIRQWSLLIPALIAFSLYGLINVLGRYIGVFVVLFWAELLANVRLPESPIYKKFTSIISITMVFIMLLNILTFNLVGLRKLLGMGNPHKFSVEQSNRPIRPCDIAQELQSLGVERGAKVGVIGYGFDSFWARLARVKIVAEILGSDAKKFWSGDASLQSEVIQAFESTGARAIVAEHVPYYAHLGGWHRVATSNYYIKVLQE